MKMGRQGYSKRRPEGFSTLPLALRLLWVAHDEGNEVVGASGVMVGEWFCVNVRLAAVALPPFSQRLQHRAQTLSLFG